MYVMRVYVTNPLGLHYYIFAFFGRNTYGEVSNWLERGFQEKAYYSILKGSKYTIKVGATDHHLVGLLDAVLEKANSKKIAELSFYLYYFAKRGGSKLKGSIFQIDIPEESTPNILENIKHLERIIDMEVMGILKKVYGNPHEAIATLFLQNEQPLSLLAQDIEKYLKEVYKEEFKIIDAFENKQLPNSIIQDEKFQELYERFKTIYTGFKEGYFPYGAVVYTLYKIKEYYKRLSKKLGLKLERSSE